MASVIEAFDEERKKMAEAHAEKDADGKAVIETDENDTQSYKIIDREAFDKAFSDLLNHEVEVDLHKISLDSFPSEIEPAFVGALFPLVDEPKKA